MNHITQKIIINLIRDILRKECPPACRPPDHQDWIRCWSLFLLFPLLLPTNTHSISTKINLKWCNAVEKSQTRPRLDLLLISVPLPFESIWKYTLGKSQTRRRLDSLLISFITSPPSSCLVSPLFLRHKIHIVSQPRCPCMDVNSDEEDVEGGRGVETPRWSGGVGWWIADLPFVFSPLCRDWKYHSK